jgi:hypothetical protein
MYLFIRGFLYECLEGQIITAFVVIVFVAAYLFREWMLQNLPDMEDDEPLQDHHNHFNNDALNHQLNQEHMALDTLENAFQILENRMESEDEQDEAIRNQLHVLMNDLENDRERKHHNERPNSSTFTVTPRLDRNLIDEDLLFGGLDGTGNKSNNSNIYHDNYDQENNTIDTHQDNHIEESHYQPLQRLTQQYHHKGEEEEEEEDLIVQNDSRKKRRSDKLPEYDTATLDAGYTAEHDQSNTYFPQPPPQPPSLSPSPLEPPISPPHYQQPDAIIDNAGDEEEAIENNNNVIINDDDDDDDDEPFDAADDINGILEAIGMRGNPWMLLQNSVLMALIISLCLGISIWVPYVIGRLVIMVSTK